MSLANPVHALDLWIGSAGGIAHNYPIRMWLKDSFQKNTFVPPLDGVFKICSSALSPTFNGRSA
jgi:hypothetical protein